MAGELKGDCDTCVYWYGYPVERLTLNPDPMEYGQCRRHAPTPYPPGLITNPSAREESTLQVFFPVTMAADCCGDYKPDKATRAEAALND